MTETTQLADHTFSPWRCVGDKRVMASAVTWKKPLKWDREAMTWPLHVELCKLAGITDPIMEWERSDNGQLPDPALMRRPRVLCPVDVFGDWEGPIVGADGLIIRRDPGCKGDMLTFDDLRRDLSALFDATPNVDWLLTTKHPENIRRMWNAVDYRPAGVPQMHRSNVFLGVTAENQEQADKRISGLLKCSDLSPVLFARLTLLGEVDLRAVHREDGWEIDALRGVYSRHHDEGIDHPAAMEHHGGGPRLGWITAAGESGPNARPTHPDWVRALRDQCAAAGVPFWFEGWGTFAPVPQNSEVPGPASVPVTRVMKSVVLRRDGDHSQFMPSSARPDAQWMIPCGAKAAGRLLDGREHNGLPEVRA